MIDDEEKIHIKKFNQQNYDLQQYQHMEEMQAQISEKNMLRLEELRKESFMQGLN